MIPLSFSIRFKEPLWMGNNAVSPMPFVTNYEHRISAIGGFWSASMTAPASQVSVDDWLQNGLGRHVLVWGDGLEKAWEGFVNQVSVQIGPLTITYGPLLDIVNQARTIYATLNTDGDPIVGTRVITADADNDDSQAQWPVMIGIVNGGTCSEAMAEAARDLTLTRSAFPHVKKELNLSGSGESSVRLECLGYYHLLNYPIFDATAGDVDADAKIIEALSQTPNLTWLVYDTQYIESNTLQVTAAELEDRIATTVIEETVNLGDSSGNRWLFGIYEDLRAHYSQAPSDVEYVGRVASSRLQVETVGGQPVPPWAVRPGRWIRIVDYLPLTSSTTNLEEDRRLMFIEDVSFREPFTITLAEGDASGNDQILAQLGIGK